MKCRGIPLVTEPNIIIPRMAMAGSFLSRPSDLQRGQGRVTGLSRLKFCCASLEALRHQIMDIDGSYVCRYKYGMGFQWDEQKNILNHAKHGISFEQAAQIFRGRILKKIDERRDYRETRFIALGVYDGEVLCVVFTERDGDYRLISARKANKYERERYQNL